MTEDHDQWNAEATDSMLHGGQHADVDDMTPSADIYQRTGAVAEQYVAGGVGLGAAKDRCMRRRCASSQAVERDLTVVALLQALPCPELDQTFPVFLSMGRGGDM